MSPAAAPVSPACTTNRSAVKRTEWPRAASCSAWRSSFEVTSYFYSFRRRDTRVSAGVRGSAAAEERERHRDLLVGHCVASPRATDLFRGPPQASQHLRQILLFIVRRVARAPRHDNGRPALRLPGLDFVIRSAGAAREEGITVGVEA